MRRSDDLQNPIGLLLPSHRAWNGKKIPLTNRSYLILKQIQQGLLDRSNRSQF